MRKVEWLLKLFYKQVLLNFYCNRLHISFLLYHKKSPTQQKKLKNLDNLIYFFAHYQKIGLKKTHYEIKKLGQRPSFTFVFLATLFLL